MKTREYRTIRNRKLGWLRHSTLFLIIITVIIIATLALVVGVQAIQNIWQADTPAVLSVPDDYADIQEAISVAEPGDIIQVSEGIYVGNLILDKPVSLIAEEFDEINPVNNRTVLDGGTGAAAITISPGLTQLPVIRGFVIRNGIAGIQAASPFVAEYNFFHSSTNLVSYDYGSGGANRNNLYFNASDNAIRLDNMDRPLVIENNRIMYSGQSGVEISLQNLTTPPALAEIDIWNNMILGNSEDGIQLIDHPGDPQNTNRRFVITGNLIANNQRAGIGLMPNADTLEDYSGADMVEDIYVYNNTFYGNDYGISGGDNLVAFNNIIANSVTRGAWRVQGTVDDNSVIAFSLFHNNKVDVEDVTLGQGVILGVDPLFEAVPNPGPDGTWATVDDDFSGLVLRSNSPAIDKGVAQYVPNDGEPIPLSPLNGFTGSAPDLGWREFGAPIFMTSTPTSIPSSTPLPTATVASLTPQPTTTALPTGSPVPASPTSASPTPVSPTLTQSPVTPLATVSTSTTLAPTATNAASSPVPSPSQMSLQSIDPVSAPANTTVTMTVAGSGFQTGAIVSIEGGEGPAQEVMVVQVIDPSTIIVTINTHTDEVVGMQTWDIRVTNPDNSTAVLVDAFTVLPPS